MTLFETELEILEHEGTGPGLLEIKKKAFLEGASAVLHDIAIIPAELKAEHEKVDTKEIVQWAQKKMDAINRELNTINAFELIHMLANP